MRRRSQLGNAVSGLRLKVTDLYAAPKDDAAIAGRIPAVSELSGN